MSDATELHHLHHTIRKFSPQDEGAAAPCDPRTGGKGGARKKTQFLGGKTQVLMLTPPPSLTLTLPPFMVLVSYTGVPAYTLVLVTNPGVSL